MITRSELRSIPKLHRQILKDKEHLKYLKEKSTSLPPGFTVGDKVQSSHENNSNKYVDAATDLNKEIKAKEKRLEELQSEAQSFIDTVEDPVKKRMLKYRYIDCCTWTDVSALMGYTERHLYRLEYEALSTMPAYRWPPSADDLQDIETEVARVYNGTGYEEDYCQQVKNGFAGDKE